MSREKGVGARWQETTYLGNSRSPLADKTGASRLTGTTHLGMLSALEAKQGQERRDPPVSKYDFWLIRSSIQ